jgi:hypothetical protein
MRKIMSNQVLAGPEASQIRAFLHAIANTESMKRLRRFQDFMPRLEWLEEHADLGYFEAKLRRGEWPEESEHNELVWRRSYGAIQNWVRSLWQCRDERTRLWLAFPLLFAYKTQGYLAPSPSIDDFIERFIVYDPLPKSSKFECAIRYLVEKGKLARVCANEECPARYFFASRQTQRYCSPKCAGPGKRDAKRRWWAKHGRAWRKKRAAKQRRSRKKRPRP